MCPLLYLIKLGHLKIIITFILLLCFLAARFISRCGLFCLLWVVTIYMYTYALKILLSTDVLALFATNVSCIYLLSWVILHEQFVGVRVSTWTLSGLVWCFRILRAQSRHPESKVLKFNIKNWLLRMLSILSQLISTIIATNIYIFTKIFIVDSGSYIMRHRYSSPGLHGRHHWQFHSRGSCARCVRRRWFCYI